MKIFIASDHAGVELKALVTQELLQAKWLPEIRREIVDLGPQSTESVDYPDFADLVCRRIHSLEVLTNEGHYSYPKEIGILICGSGQGMAMRANKYSHIRAALCYSPEITRLSREHNDANVLCLGSRFTSTEEALTYIEIFLKTTFAGGRHALRTRKITQNNQES